MTTKLINIFMVMAFWSFLGSTSPEGQINDLEKFRLKGKVKSILETKYAIPDKSDKTVDKKVLYQKFTLFDANGYEQQRKLYKDGSEYLYSNFISGIDGKQLEMNEFLPDGTLNLNVKYAFDDKGNWSEAVYAWSEDRVIGELCEAYDYYFEIIQNEIFYTVRYKYEYRGFCTEESFIKADSSLSFKLTAKYDFKGNKLESAYFRGNEMLSWVTKYSYDRYDNLVESKVFKSNRIAVSSKYKYKFDDTGNWISRSEDREVFVNIFTAGLNPSDMLTEREIEYY